MNFWRLTHPAYASDYQHTWINGALRHPFGLPGVRCDVCGDTWGGSRILPYLCPENLRHDKHLSNRWPISRAEHFALQKELMGVLALTGDPFLTLRPGDSLQPAILDIPTRPRADFLWSSPGSLIVSERLKNILVQLCPDDFTACAVTFGKVGNTEATQPAPVPSSGEPEDMLAEAPLLATTIGIAPYYELLVRNESCTPAGRMVTSICRGCQRPDVPVTTQMPKMTPELWRGPNLFFLATTLYILVTDMVKSRLEQAGATNIAFVPA